MDAAMRQKTVDTVNDFVNRGFMFTAYDVTKTLRKDGSRVRHSDVNSVVQELFSQNQMGMYNRETVNVGAPIEPFVYFHPYSDVNNYKSDWVEANPTQAGMKQDEPDTDDTLTVTPASTSANGNGDGSTNPSDAATTSAASPGAVNPPVAAVNHPRSTKNVKIPTREVRLQIPSQMIKQHLGQPGSPLTVVPAIDYSSGTAVKKLIISPPTLNTKVYYKVNKDGRIRLAPEFVRFLGGTTYDIHPNNGEIVVTPK